MSTPDLIYIKPVKGRTARDHRTKMTIPEEGMFVRQGDPHWMEFLRFGDVELVDTPPRKPGEDAPEPVGDAKAEPLPAADQH